MLAQTASSPFLIDPKRFDEYEDPSRLDLATAGAILLPAFLLAGGLLIGGSRSGATVVVGLAFMVSCFIAPQIGVYAYFALQGIDSAFTQGSDYIFTPAKALGPFILLTWLGWASRRRTQIFLSMPFTWWMIAFGVFGLLTAAVSIQPFAAMRYSSQLVVQAMLAIACIDMLHTRRYIHRAMFFMVVGGAIAAGIVYVTGGQSSRYDRATVSEFTNPNTTAMAISMSIAAIPAAWAYNRSFFNYVLYLVLGPFMIPAMLKTGSRAAIIALAAGMSIGIVFARGGNVVKRLLLAILCFGATVSTFFIVLQAKVLPFKAQDRMEAFVTRESRVTEDSRMDIWKAAIEVYLDYPLIGFGYGNTAYVLEREHGQFRDIHNVYLGALVDGGPIALFLFLMGLWHLFRTTRTAQTSRQGVPGMIMLVVLLMSGVTHTIQFTKWFWIPATICLLLAEDAERERRAREARELGLPLGPPGA